MSLFNRYKIQSQGTAAVAKLRRDMINDRDSKYVILVDTGSEVEELGTYRVLEDCKFDIDNLREQGTVVHSEIYYYSGGFQFYNY